MTYSLIETYYKKGWLKCGDHTFSATDRFVAAQKIQQLYDSLEDISIGVVDLQKPRVDGGKIFDPADRYFDTRKAFLNLWKKLSQKHQMLLETIVLKNQKPYLEKIDAQHIRQLKKNLNAALDCLIFAYSEQFDNKEGDYV
ncbi:MAG: hypothetical protein J5895_00695 [Alphaproteobacteria bacterium]|nr:hypothetical protein [Alphaproteobacteria bacterium]